MNFLNKCVTLIALLGVLHCTGNRTHSTDAANEGTLSVSPDSGSVTSIAGLSSARGSHTATLLPNGKVLIAGGMERNGVFFSTAEIFDPKSGKFTLSRSSMSVKKTGHTATLLPNGKVLLLGGWEEQKGTIAVAEIYDPAKDEFSSAGNMKSPRGEHTATLLSNGKVLVVGGFDGTNCLATSELYDPATGVFTETGVLRSARDAHTATLLADGKVLITGGEAARNKILTSAELYDPKTGIFTPTGDLTRVRYKHAATLLPDGKVFIVGGSDDKDWNGRYKSTEMYDPGRGVFAACSDMNVSHFKIPSSVLVLSNGKVLVAGGNHQVELFDPGTLKFSVVGTLDEARFYDSATAISDGRVLIVGGYGYGTRATGPLSTPHAWIFQS